MAEAADALALDDAACAALVPARDARGHKGSNGRLVCLSGSLEYAGAALLSALAAVRAGAGLVVLAVPESIQPVIAGRVVEAVTLGLPETSPGVFDVEASRDRLTGQPAQALLAGPGLRESEEAGELLLHLLRDRPAIPFVLDGGALNLLSRSGEWWTDATAPCVLTPHPREFERLTGAAVRDDDAERSTRCVEAARRFGQVVVLKGANTVIAAPDGRLARAPFANAALATAGTGDVLGGTIGALLAQGMRPFEAACLGVYLHGAAGERISQQVGDAGLAASDLPLEIALQRRRLAALRERDAAGRVGFGRR
ncbi:MAG: NAD(P)H-hydrate dehydratase [Chloroflexota bacterium]|nr:NAD(P)H-hydrate dehydratase [Chloroflexota bacterium]